MNSVLRSIRKVSRSALSRMRGRFAARQLEQPGLVTLMFHKVASVADPLNLTIRPDLFDAILSEVQKVGPIVRLTPAIALSEIAARNNVCFAITFDDGYRDNYTAAFPILRKQNANASIFLSVDFIDGNRVFWYERLEQSVHSLSPGELDLREWNLGVHAVPSGGARTQLLLHLNNILKMLDDDQRQNCVEWIESQRIVRDTSATEMFSPMLTWTDVTAMSGPHVQFGSHTMSHCILSRESPERVDKELVESKFRIESAIGERVEIFAYPNGRTIDFNDATVDSVRRAGYSLAVTTVPGINRAPLDMFRLRRTNVHSEMCTDYRGEFDKSLFWAKVCQLL